MGDLSERKRIPIIIFSDSPSAPTGLARITRDIASRIFSKMPDFDIATFGYGGPGSVRLPFQQYNWKQNDYWLPLELPAVWADFCSDTPGILLTIGDIQRFLQLSSPDLCLDKPFGGWMRQMRESGKLKLWGYFPIDAHGIDNKLTPQLGYTLQHYDRILVPSEWARTIILNTLPDATVDVIPHGIDTTIFRPRDREYARNQFMGIAQGVMKWPTIPTIIPPDALTIGIVATNQSRKDWGLAAETLSLLAKKSKERKIFIWAHTDRLKNSDGWGLLELFGDFNLLPSTVITTGNLTDYAMSWCYNAMELTLGIGRGEGFGYPIFESLFCATPCFAYNYGAHVEYMDKDWVSGIPGLRVEGPLNLLRPVGDPRQWAEQINKLYSADNHLMRFPSELDWERVWPRFEKWITDGVKEVKND
jgi:glycosyltransferase involved in cell wall biosynthesis